ncbi:hypothetical protein MNB_SV-6-1761 [hydrothermal vent metagenome]|uniref:Uncharacterized protein n=1 Tax=hydrothermal vent metagenome TaxID=652676 RepID=A0A1W1BYS3_9ZZZZ
MCGYDMTQDTVLAKIDQTGNIIWKKTFTSNINGRSNLLIINGRYIVSQKQLDGGKTFVLDKNKKTIKILPYYFDSMSKTTNGFVGVSGTMVLALDRDGKELWRRVPSVDKSSSKEKVISISKNALKTSIVKKKIYTETYSKIVRLRDGTLVAVGNRGHYKLVLIKLTQDGKMLWRKEIHKTKLYSISGAVATDDGGFIISMSGIDIMKFSPDGSREFHTKIKNYYNGYAGDIIETDNGYISINQVGTKANILILKLNKRGDMVWDKEYRSNMRLHAKSIIKAYDGGYLLSINREINNPMLVKMDSKGNIKTDLSKKIKASVQVKSADSSNAEVVMVKKRFEFFGGALRQMIPSKKSKLLYMITGASGFSILNICDFQNPKLLSNFSKSKLKLKIAPNLIAPVGRSLPGKGLYDYNEPFELYITKDETKAYIIDLKQGFYILDITDKKKPKLIQEFRRFRGHYFVVSKDEKKIYIADTGTINLIDLSSKSHSTTLLPYTSSSVGYPVTPLAIFASRDILYVADRNKIAIYDIKKSKVIDRVATDGMIYSIYIDSDLKRLYLLNRIGFEAFAITKDSLLKHLWSIRLPHRESIKSFYVTKDEKSIYYASDNGVKLLDTKDKLNPKIVKIYTTPTMGSVAYVAPIGKNKELLVGFHTPKSIGVIKIER